MTASQFGHIPSETFRPFHDSYSTMSMIRFGQPDHHLCTCLFKVPRRTRAVSTGVSRARNSDDQGSVVLIECYSDKSSFIIIIPSISGTERR